MTQTAYIRPVTSAADLSALVALTNAVTPDDPTSLAEMRWSDATYPGIARYLADQDGHIGAATVGRIFVYPPEHPDLWASIVVAPEAQRQGNGSRLLQVGFGTRP